MSVFNCALVSVLLCNYIAETLVGGRVVPLCFFIAVSWSTFVFTELQLNLKMVEKKDNLEMHGRKCNVDGE